MWKYVLKRIGLALVTAFIILSLTFILMKLVPIDKPPGTDEARFSYWQSLVYDGFVEKTTNEKKAAGQLDHKHTFEKGKCDCGAVEPLDVVTLNSGKVYYYKVPALKQYVRWLKNIATEWNWGTSTAIKPNVSAMHIIGERLPNTIKLNVVSVIFSVPLGILLGIWAALKKNTLTDHIISTSVMIFISIPSFVLITFLLLLLCYNNQILPSQWPSDTAPQAEKIKGFIIPVFCLSFGSICGYCRFVRAELCEVMSSEYLLLARTKGLTKRQAILRHALRNAMVPIVPSILAEVIGLLGGSMILERLYGILGIGELFITALNKKDYNVLMVDMALFTTISLLAGVVLDISYGFIDPRIRMGAKK